MPGSKIRLSCVSGVSGEAGLLPVKFYSAMSEAITPPIQENKMNYNEKKKCIVLQFSNILFDHMSKNQNWTW